LASGVASRMMSAISVSGWSLELVVFGVFIGEFVAGWQLW
jgi:hypothetical protein